VLSDCCFFKALCTNFLTYLFTSLYRQQWTPGCLSEPQARLAEGMSNSICEKAYATVLQGSLSQGNGVPLQSTVQLISNSTSSLSHSKTLVEKPLFQDNLGKQIICTSLQTDNHARTWLLNFYRPDALPDAKPTVSKHRRQLLWSKMQKKLLHGCVFTTLNHCIRHSGRKTTATYTLQRQKSEKKFHRDSHKNTSFTRITPTPTAQNLKWS